MYNGLPYEMSRNNKIIITDKLGTFLPELNVVT